MFGEMIMGQVFIDSEDGDWYLIPADRANAFQELQEEVYKPGGTIDAFLEEFGEMRITHPADFIVNILEAK